VLQNLVGALGGHWDDIWKEAGPLKSEIEQQKLWLDQALPSTSGFVQCNWTLDSSRRRTRRILQVRRQERPSLGSERAQKVRFAHS
jgi:hypothetical protein